MKGSIKEGDEVQFVHTGKEYTADDVGVLRMDMLPRKQISAGGVGYIITGIKVSKEIKVGDTITHVENPTQSAIQGFEEVKPKVIACIFTIGNDNFVLMRNSL